MNRCRQVRAQSSIQQDRGIQIDFLVREKRPMHKEGKMQIRLFLGHHAPIAYMFFQFFYFVS